MTTNSFMPMVVEKVAGGERSYDLTSRLMKERMILIDGGVDTALAHVVCAQLLWLESQGSEDIVMYINSPGGSVHDGLKIADMMDMVRCDIKVICSGMGASMGCYLTAKGTKGKRFMTKNASLMAHQVSAGQSGHIEDMRASFKHTDFLNDKLMGDLSRIVGKEHEQFMLDCNRDFWMTAEEARDYGTDGFVDGVITGKDKETGDLIIEYRSSEKPVKATKVTKAKKV